MLALSNPGNYKAVTAVVQYQYTQSKGDSEAAKDRAATGHVLGGPAAVPVETLDWCNHVYDHAS